MTGLDGRVYLDWNASAPLRPEARAAMLAAMDAIGNPSSVHAEGRAARAIVEKARGQVAALVGCEPSQVVFTSGATEANATVAYMASPSHSQVEHESIGDRREPAGGFLPVDRCGVVDRSLAKVQYEAMRRPEGSAYPTECLSIGAANGETGVLQPVEELFREFRSTELANPARRWGAEAWLHTDATQAIGKTDFCFDRSFADLASCSGHKIGGPRGVGALVDKDTTLFEYPLIEGGGQESGRRSGTENVVGIAGFGAAAEAARRDLEDGVWDRVERLRDALEERLESAAADLILVGKGVPRLPNTSCFAVPGWAGETQVMQMDLAGFAVSAGSACSSGKVKKASRVLLAMGFDEVTASSAIRVSMGPTTTEAEAMAFADAWIERYRRRASRAA